MAAVPVTSSLLILFASWFLCVNGQIYGDVRLVNGGQSSSGRVEIYYGSQWGTVCDDGWDDDDASVVCRQLGYPGWNAISRRNAYFGRGSGPIHLDDVSCNGFESYLDDCTHSTWGDDNCDHSEDAGVECEPTTGDIRLVDGSNANEGRVEIYYGDQWGTVCDDQWDSNDAEVVCRQLGYDPNGAIARSDAYYGQGSGAIFLDDVSCNGWENRLEDCSNAGWQINNCGHYEDAGVVCEEYEFPTTWNPWFTSAYSSGDIRLVGGSKENEGRVEIYYRGQWGTVCDDQWDSNDAEVVCRQLGYDPNGAIARSNAYYGEGSGAIFLEDVSCFGWETRLEDCSNPGWQIENCGHDEDAGVVCEDHGTASLVTGMMAFVGVSLFILIIISVSAVYCVAFAQKKVVNPSPNISVQPTNATDIPSNAAVIDQRGAFTNPVAVPVLGMPAASHSVVGTADNFTALPPPSYNYPDQRGAIP